MLTVKAGRTPRLAHTHPRPSWLPKTVSSSIPILVSGILGAVEKPTRTLTQATTGVDDVLALLLALTARPEELELAMISVTYGNVSLQRYSE